MERRAFVGAIVIAVKRATNAIPLVMVAVGDPFGTGLVASLARPGRNLTGLVSIAPDLERKRLVTLKAAKVLGLTIPKAILLRADQVIEPARAVSPRRRGHFVSVSYR